MAVDSVVQLHFRAFRRGDSVRLEHGHAELRFHGRIPLATDNASISQQGD